MRFNCLDGHGFVKGAEEFLGCVIGMEDAGNSCCNLHAHTFTRARHAHAFENEVCDVPALIVNVCRCVAPASDSAARGLVMMMVRDWCARINRRHDLMMMLCTHQSASWQNSGD